MTTMTATPSTTATPGKAGFKAGFKAWLRKVGAELRRAFELSGAPYADGALPPL
ncbi:hypothetical protein [Massilia suwonensis]|uniref:Uncharacterized protein n=1 Tax=Massilia suwonensis TaxID=648895 RepID=A0ABW0ML88_9BURK